PVVRGPRAGGGQPPRRGAVGGEDGGRAGVLPAPAGVEAPGAEGHAPDDGGPGAGQCVRGAVPPGGAPGDGRPVRGCQTAGSARGGIASVDVESRAAQNKRRPPPG